MENRKLPNANTILILGIASIVTCCCYGIVGLVFGVVALVLENKDSKLYAENPEIYTNHNSLFIGKILAIIGIVLSAIYLMFTIYFLSLGEEGRKEFQENLMEKMKHMEENQ